MPMIRCQFPGAADAAGSAFAAPSQSKAQARRKKVRISDVRCTIVRGTRDWNLIEAETDPGLYGLGEAYWG